MKTHDFFGKISKNLQSIRNQVCGVKWLMIVVATVICRLFGKHVTRPKGQPRFQGSLSTARSSEGKTLGIRLWELSIQSTKKSTEKSQVILVRMQSRIWFCVEFTGLILKILRTDWCYLKKSHWAWFSLHVKQYDKDYIVISLHKWHIWWLRLKPGL